MGSPQYQGPAGRLVDGIREAVRIFASSCVSNDELVALAAASGPARKLVPDARVRWNSTLRMMSRFLELEHPLRQYYHDAKRTPPGVQRRRAGFGTGHRRCLAAC